MTVSKLKKELDKWFSLYIRLRDCNEYGTGTMLYLWKDSALQNWRDAKWSFSCQEDLWLLDIQKMENCEIQCSGCNMFKFGGEQFRFHYEFRC
jgi:hypothetical protein